MISTTIVNIFFTNIYFHNCKYIGGNDGDPIPLSGDACQEVALTVPPYIAIGSAGGDCDHFVISVILIPPKVVIGNADRDCDQDNQLV